MAAIKKWLLFFMYSEEELRGKSGIYKWTSPSGKSYVGQTKDLGGRHKDFRCGGGNRKYSGYNSMIDRARKKYPYSKWTYEVLEYCSIEDLDEREKYWIDYYDTTNPKKGYNITGGGVGGCGIPKSSFKKGRVRTEEEMSKAKETLKKHMEEGSVNYEDRSKKVALYNLDGSLYKVYKSFRELARDNGVSEKRIPSEQYVFQNKYMVRRIYNDVPLLIEPYEKKKITLSEETKEKMRKAHLGKELPSTWKSVIALNDNDEVVYEFKSIKEAAFAIHPENTKSAQKNIQCVCAAKPYFKEGAMRVTKKVYGYKWRYKEKEAA